MAMNPTVRFVRVPLVLLLLFMLAAPLFAEVDVHPGDTPLIMRYYDAMRDDDAPLAAELMGRFLENQPNNGIFWYNYACLLARTGQDSMALVALGNSIEAGFFDADWAAQDADLSSLKSSSQFPALMEKMRAAGVEAAKDKRQFRWLPQQRVGRYELWLPEDYDPATSKPLPVVMFLHGASGDVADGERFARRMISEGFAVVLIEGAYRSNDGLGYDQVPRIGNDVLLADSRPARPTSIEMSVAWYRQVLDDAGTVAKLDRKHVILVGFSQGAFQIAYILAQSPELYSAAAMIGGRIPEAVNHADLFKPFGKKQGQALLLQGELDQVGDPNAVKECFEQAGVKTEVIRYPGLNHEIVDPMVEDFAKWAVKVSK